MIQEFNVKTANFVSMNSNKLETKNVQNAKPTRPISTFLDKNVEPKHRNIITNVSERRNSDGYIYGFHSILTGSQLIKKMSHLNFQN